MCLRFTIDPVIRIILDNMMLIGQLARALHVLCRPQATLLPLPTSSELEAG